MRRVVRHVLALLGGSALIAACSGLGAISGDQSYDVTEYLRRWNVTDASGKTLSVGCTQQSLPGPGYAKNVIDVKAPAGSVIIYEDNLGIESVEKSRNNQPLPTSDAYWCSKQDIAKVWPNPNTWFDTVQVTDAQPPATIQKIELVNPTKDSQNQTSAEGIRLHLRVQHAGILHLGFLVSTETDAGIDAGDAGADAGTQLEGVYPAMTIE